MADFEVIEFEQQPGRRVAAHKRQVVARIENGERVALYLPLFDQIIALCALADGAGVIIGKGRKARGYAPIEWYEDNYPDMRAGLTSIREKVAAMPLPLE